MRYLLMMLAAALLLAIASGCPQQSEQTKEPAAGDAPATQPAENAPTVDEPEPEPAVVEDTQPAPEPGTEPTSTEEEGDDTAASGGGDDALAGEWLALFGRKGLQISEDAWQSGHRVKITSDGSAEWMILTGGRPTASLKSTWRAKDGEMWVSFTAGEASVLPSLGPAPLIAGRDEEIGLLGGKASSLPAGHDQQHSQQVNQRVQYTLDGDFLCMRQDEDVLTVYGRVGAGGSAPGAVNESWEGDAGLRRKVAAEFKLDGAKLNGEIPEQRGRFDGQFVEGYFVGHYQTTSRMSLAALTITREGELSGILLPDPYRQIETSFDFSPVK